MKNTGKHAFLGSGDGIVGMHELTFAGLDAF